MWIGRNFTEAFPAFVTAGGDAADVQYCYRIEFGSDFVYGGEVGGGQVERVSGAAVILTGLFVVRYAVLAAE